MVGHCHDQPPRSDAKQVARPASLSDEDGEVKLEVGGLDCSAKEHAAQHHVEHAVHIAMAPLQLLDHTHTINQSSHLSANKLILLLPIDKALSPSRPPSSPRQRQQPRPTYRPVVQAGQHEAEAEHDTGLHDLVQPLSDQT